MIDSRSVILETNPKWRYHRKKRHNFCKLYHNFCKKALEGAAFGVDFSGWVEFQKEKLIKACIQIEEIE